MDDKERCIEAQDRILLWDFEGAWQLIGDWDAPEDSLPWVNYHRALLFEFRGEFELANRLYEEACAADPELGPPPARMSDDAAAKLLSDIASSFPADVQAALDHVRIEIIDMPDPQIEGTEHDPLMLGVYHGTPITERVWAPYHMPEVIRIFKRNIERIAGDREQLIEQLRITLLHEVGHHLGWDEDEVARRGLA